MPTESIFGADLESTLAATLESTLESATDVPQSTTDSLYSTDSSTDSLIDRAAEPPAWERYDGSTPETFVPASDASVAPAVDPGPWDHQPDPEAVNTGFYVDWGTSDENDDTPAAWHSLLGTEGATALQDDPQADPTLNGYGYAPSPTGFETPTDAETGAEAESTFIDVSERRTEPAIDTTDDNIATDEVTSAEPETTFTSQWAARASYADTAETSFVEPDFTESTFTEPFTTDDTDTPALTDAPTFEPATFADTTTFEDTVTETVIPEVLDDEPGLIDVPVADELPPIMWRAETPALEAGPPAESTEPEPEVEEFVFAGPDWQLGNALPLVEVRGQGALVMRRADERWALADVSAADDFAVEVDVDFRSGPGLGVLFRADVDAEGRMSGYSFDIDPIYDGGGYLVRQWQADRELWNPIARVGAGDITSMYGKLTIRLVLHDDHLVALVNGTEVLRVESLKQASIDRGREAAEGHRVGVQAWSSSDLVIETLRVAAH